MAAARMEKSLKDFILTRNHGLSKKYLIPYTCNVEMWQNE